ncbi:hypothetical protein FB192DRAFT_1404167 [Mucor lusitanicus]|uniref:Uncharacterized protein n=1 Tax=Mucor circinelloides f. lusitanicus TaxID=29924 RepID=A0A8H4EW10_MUCCL|nr:hypothetical protein FB192DRAFT_1404167 [Mucor lusitanicus]
MSLAVRVVKQVVQGLLKQKKGRTMINLTIYSHLNRQYDVDYLQDGDLKWDVPADDSMTDKLCKYRRDSIKGAKKNRFLSDIRLLSILNIFPYGHLQGSYSICEVIEGIDCQKVCCPASPIVEIDGPSQAIKALRIDIVRERKTSTPTATTIKPTAITNQVVLRILDQWRFSLVERLGQLVEYNRESVLFPTCLSFHFTIIGKYV